MIRSKEYMGKLLIAKFIALVILSVFSSFSNADWQKVYPMIRTVWPTSDPHKHFNDQFDLYVDRTVENNPSGTVTMWHMHDYSATRNVNDTNHLSKSSRYEYECNRKLGRNLGIRGYADHMAEGLLVATYDFVGEWENVGPGSMFEVTWEIACDKVTASPIDSWLFNADEGKYSASTLTLTGANGETYPVSTTALKNLDAVFKLIAAQSGISPPLFLFANDSPNAFAGGIYHQRIMAFTLPMLNVIGGDQSALATTVGHELAHLFLSHDITAEKISVTPVGKVSPLNKLINVFRAPVNALMDIRAMYVSAAYSRGQEREADELGMKWAIAAGFSPCGVAVTMNALKEIKSEFSAPFLSSHPSESERAESANQASQKLYGHAC